MAGKRRRKRSRLAARLLIKCIKASGRSLELSDENLVVYLIAPAPSSALPPAASMTRVITAAWVSLCVVAGLMGAAHGSVVSGFLVGRQFAYVGKFCFSYKPTLADVAGVRYDVSTFYQ